MLNRRPRPIFPSLDLRQIIAPTTPAVLSAELFVDGLDPGWQSPCVLIRGAMLAPKHLHVFACMTHRRTTIAEIMRRSDALPYPRSTIVGADHSATAADQTSGRSIKQMLEATGRRVINPWLPVRNRLCRLRAWLPAGNLAGLLTIDPACSELIGAVSRYAGLELRKNQWTCTTPRDSHCVDALSYLVLAAELLDSRSARTNTVHVVSLAE